MIKCFLVAMMSLEDNKHALYQLLAHPKYALRGDGPWALFQSFRGGGASQISQCRRCVPSGQEKDTLSAQPCFSFRENGKILGA